MTRDGPLGGAEALDFDQAPSDGPGAHWPGLSSGGAAPVVDGRARQTPLANGRAQGCHHARTARACGHEDGLIASVASTTDLGSADAASLDVRGSPCVAPDAGPWRASARPEALAMRTTYPGRCPLVPCCSSLALLPAVAGLVWLLRVVSYQRGLVPQMGLLPSWATEAATLP